MNDEKSQTEDPVQADDLPKRIEGVEYELKELRENVGKSTRDLNEAVSTLKDAIVQIRMAISEIENPFNILRAINSENDVRKIEEMKGITKTIEINNSPEAAIDSEGETTTSAHSVEDNEPASISPSKEIEKALPKQDSDGAWPQEAHIDKPSLTILKWIWSLLDLGLDVDDADRISEYCEYLGYLKPGASKLVARLTPVVEKARTKGISVEELVLNIYGAAAASGIDLTPSDLREVVLGAIRTNASPRCR